MPTEGEIQAAVKAWEAAGSPMAPDPTLDDFCREIGGRITHRIGQLNAAQARVGFLHGDPTALMDLTRAQWKLNDAIAEAIRFAAQWNSAANADPPAGKRPRKKRA